MSLTFTELAAFIDHAVLSPTATLDDILSACRMGAQYQVAVVCVRSSDVPIAANVLQCTRTKTGTVIGFPHGTTSTAGKVTEAQQAIKDGARELDMVLNIGRLLSDDRTYVENDIRAVCEVAHAQRVLLKVIFETCYLSDDQKIIACELCTKAGVDYVKTSTGFGPRGATLSDIILMRNHISPGMGIKASGGLRTLDDVLAALACGATRIGTSSTEKILEEAKGREAKGQLREMSFQEAWADQKKPSSKR